MPEEGIVVDRHFGIESHPLAAAGQHQRVDLGQRRIFFHIRVVELPGDGCEPGDLVWSETESKTDLPRLPWVKAEKRIDQGTDDALWPLAGDLFDVNAALGTGHDDVLAAGAIKGNAEIELLGDIGRWGNQYLSHDVTADVETKNRRGSVAGLGWCAGQLHSAGFATTTGVNLSLDHDRTTGGLGDRFRVLRRGSDFAAIGANTVGRKELRRLVLVQVHDRALVSERWRRRRGGGLRHPSIATRGQGLPGIRANRKRIHQNRLTVDRSLL